MTLRFRPDLVELIGLEQKRSISYVVDSANEDWTKHVLILSKGWHENKIVFPTTLREAQKDMKAHWFIIPLIFMLIPLFILSREHVSQRVEMPDDVSAERKAETITLVPDEEDHAIYESVSKFRMHMKSLDEYDYELASAIDRQYWDDISKYALLLKNTSPVIFTGKRKIELPKEFVLLDTTFHFQTLAVVEASESREMVKLNIEYEKLQKTCDDCHEKYKKK